MMLHPVQWIKRWRLARLLRKARIPEQQWQACITALPVLHGLNQGERHHLRELASLFLQMKSFSGARGLVVTDEMRYQVAAQACLLILELDLTYFDHWHEVILYPDAFVVRREVTDECGLVRSTPQVLGGEAWDRGPVVLSWDDVLSSTRSHETCANVVIHEFAHKLDMLNGVANGMPPLHRQMRREVWTDTFSDAYRKLTGQLDSHISSEINPYGATNPAEFFAVVSEYFFTCPKTLQHFSSGVYEQLRLFYRQDPHRWKVA